jgi:hypothetical protein
MERIAAQRRNRDAAGQITLLIEAEEKCRTRDAQPARSAGRTVKGGRSARLIASKIAGRVDSAVQKEKDPAASAGSF